MKLPMHIRTILTLAGLVLLAGQLVAAPMGTTFTYQGRLDYANAVANGSYDLKFTLYDALSGGSVVGSPQTNAAVTITNGLFTVTLNFGPSAFPGDARWLEMGVRSNSGGYDFTMLSPRQELTPTPYALYAPNAGTVGGLAATNFWQLGGNGGTTPGTHFLGTTDNKALELKVNNQRVLRLEPHVSGPNVVGGSANNTVAAGVSGATIAGGLLNDVGTTSSESAIGGGSDNNIAANSPWVAIAGGRANDIGINSFYSAIGGGYDNNIADNSNSGTIAGGYMNDIGINAVSSAISGGENNNIAANATYSTIAGGSYNDIGTNADASAIGGGSDNNIAAESQYSTIAGGYVNNIGNNSASSTIAGGSGNTVETGASYSTIGGGNNNMIQSDARTSTIGGGDNNMISAYASTIGGGSVNIIHPDSEFSTIGGGDDNRIYAYAFYSTIAGGIDNWVQTNASYSTIGGGKGNTIQTNAEYATIPGGNRANASSYGQMAYASGSFAYNGDAQSSLFVVRGTTSGATTSPLFLDDGSASRRMVVPNNTVWTFDILVAACKSDRTEVASFTVRGVISNIGGTTTLPVAATVTTIYRTDAAWNVTVTADNANDALVVSGTGNTGDTIRWVATVRTAEVTY